MNKPTEQKTLSPIEAVRAQTNNAHNPRLTHGEAIAKRLRVHQELAHLAPIVEQQCASPTCAFVNADPQSKNPHGDCPFAMGGARCAECPLPEDMWRKLNAAEAPARSAAGLPKNGAN